MFVKKKFWHEFQVKTAQFATLVKCFSNPRDEFRRFHVIKLCITTEKCLVATMTVRTAVVAYGVIRLSSLFTVWA